MCCGVKVETELLRAQAANRKYLCTFPEAPSDLPAIPDLDSFAAEGVNVGRGGRCHLLTRPLIVNKGPSIVLQTVHFTVTFFTRLSVPSYWEPGSLEEPRVSATSPWLLYR